MASLTAAAASLIDNTQRSLIERIVTEVEQPVTQTRTQWEHNEPIRPFRPHEDLDGLEYTHITRNEALSKDGWGVRAVTGKVSQFVGPIWHPGDHDGCKCGEPEQTVEERVVIDSAVVVGDQVLFDGHLEFPPPTLVPFLPAVLNAARDGLLRNDIDDDIESGRMFNTAVSNAFAAVYG